MPVPAAPVISALVNYSGNNLRTTWGAVAGATSYKFFFGSDDPTTPTDFDDAATSPYEVGFDGTHIWYIRVKAHNASGDSAFSNLVGVRPGQAPRAPTLAVVALGDDGATLTWNYVGDEDVNAYAIYRAGTVNPIVLLEDTLPGTPYEDAGLAPGTYHYRVTATNSHGESLYSNDVSIEIVAPVPDPTAPVLTRVEHRGLLDYRLHFSRPDPIPEGYDIVDYWLENGAGHVVIPVSDVVSTSDGNAYVNVPDLDYDGSYSLTLKAHFDNGDVDGYGPFSNALTVFVPAEYEIDEDPDPTSAAKHAAQMGLGD
jgi:large repetitive protein